MEQKYLHQKQHIVYGLFDPITGYLHYVGYTSYPSTRYIGHCKIKEGTREKQIWLRSLKKQGLKPIMEIIEEYQTADELPEAEDFWYKYFMMQNCELYNDPHWIGSKSGQGRIPTEETRKKMSEARKGKPPWNKGRKGQISGMEGKKHLEESKKKMSESRKGQIPWNKGIPMSEEQKEKCKKTWFKPGDQPKNAFKKGYTPWNKNGGKMLKYPLEFQKKIYEDIKSGKTYNTVAKENDIPIGTITSFVRRFRKS